MDKKVTCDKCYCINSHALGCENQTREELIAVAQAWAADYKQVTGELRDRIRRQKETITFWQGKFRIVKDENNALRRKLVRR